MTRAFALLARSLLALLGLAMLTACADEPEPTGPVVLAAASMQEALEDAADQWAAKGHLRPVLSFASSGALARQIAIGSPADLFISADETWMDWVAQEVSIRDGSRADLAGNTLVLVAPAGSTLAFPARGRWGKALGGGKLALADPDAVPAGRYAKASLLSTGVWDEVKDQVVLTADVRGALALVGRGDAALGVVYATDAMADAKARGDAGVRIVGTLPESSHRPIVYPMAIPARARNPDAEAFRLFLLSEAGQRILADHGFSPPPSPARDDGEASGAASEEAAL